MKNRKFIICIISILAAELGLLFLFVLGNRQEPQDTVAVNELLHFLEGRWDELEEHYRQADRDEPEKASPEAEQDEPEKASPEAEQDEPEKVSPEADRKDPEKAPPEAERGHLEKASPEADRGIQEKDTVLENLDHAVLDREGNLLYTTRPELGGSINQAVQRRDTILDIEQEGITVGKLILYNDSLESLREQRRGMALCFGIFLLLQWGICLGYMAWLNRRIVSPFHKLKGFAERVAGGDLEVPMEMDRQNIFGAFTESFDIMRAELQRARKAEAEANAGKRELVAELSHDIRTPVASIRAASEVGALLAERAVQGDPAEFLESIRENYTGIIRKTDQINTLVTNLFTAALEDLERLSVKPAHMESRELKEILENADYLHRASLPALPDCLLWADRLRLQQVFDNLFANSYKYADTPIRLQALREEGRFCVVMEDRGCGVCREELPLLKEKFRRGKNADKAEGAGLGLYISDFFMREMQGDLLVENGETGLKVTVVILQSGREI